MNGKRCRVLPRNLHFASTRFPVCAVNVNVGFAFHILNDLNNSD